MGGVMVSEHRARWRERLGWVKPAWGWVDDVVRCGPSRRRWSGGVGRNQEG